MRFYCQFLFYLAQRHRPTCSFKLPFLFAPDGTSYLALDDETCYLEVDELLEILYDAVQFQRLSSPDIFQIGRVHPHVDE